MLIQVQAARALSQAQALTPEVSSALIIVATTALGFSKASYSSGIL